MNEQTMITLRGRIGTDLKSRTTQNGQLIVRFRLAVSQWRRRDDGSYEDQDARWYTVRAWDRLGEHAIKSVIKGHPIIVVGRPSANAWVDAAGEVHSEIVIDAKAIGHDLNTGISQFWKTTGAPSVDQDTEPKLEQPGEPHEDEYSVPPAPLEGGDAPKADHGSQGAVQDGYEAAVEDSARGAFPSGAYAHSA